MNQFEVRDEHNVASYRDNATVGVLFCSWCESNWTSTHVRMCVHVHVCTCVCNRLPLTTTCSNGDMSSFGRHNAQARDVQRFHVLQHNMRKRIQTSANTLKRLRAAWNATETRGTVCVSCSYNTLPFVPQKNKDSEKVVLRAKPGLKKTMLRPVHGRLPK